jgi:hypothetical protein
VKHIDLDAEDEHVKQFVLSLPIDPQGSLLEIHGKPVARVLPMAGAGVPYDRDRLKAAILARRDESRRLNDEWEHVDRESWERLPVDER